MVKSDFCVPRDFVVTPFAGLPLLPFVRIVLGVARIAGRRDLFREDAALVTALTRSPRVGAA